MKKLFLNLSLLVCAIAVFAGSGAAAFGAIPMVEPEPTEEESQNEIDFNSENDLFITDLISPSDCYFAEGLSLAEYNPFAGMPKREASSEESSSEPTSSEEPLPSQPVSSEPSSSETVSSEETSSEESSSEESSSEETSSEESSEEEPPSEEENNDFDEYVDEDFLYTLAGAVQREIIGVNTNPQPQYYEAYKAQAVASHSYMEYYRQLNGSYPVMSFCQPKQATIDLIRGVVNEVMYYNGSVINASYHAAAGGHTQGANYVWGNSIGYLQGVESAYDDYYSATTISVSSVEQKLAAAGIAVSGEPEDWFDLANASYTDGEFVDYIPICGQYIKGRTLRENILGAAVLRSNKIVGISVLDGNFVFETKGYGHGVGMSQQGALGYSANGYGYQDILTHYYTGVTIQ